MKILIPITLGNLRERFSVEKRASQYNDSRVAGDEALPDGELSDTDEGLLNEDDLLKDVSQTKTPEKVCCNLF